MRQIPHLVLSKLGLLGVRPRDVVDRSPFKLPLFLL